MNGILIGFVAGAAGFHLLSATPGLWWTALCLPALLLWRTPRLRPWVAVWLGGCWSLVQVNDQMAHWLPRHLEGQDLILQGIVEDLPRVDARLQRFQLKVDSLQDPQGNPVPVSRLQLSWFGRSDLLQAGETWRLKVRLRQPRGLHNPAGYDRERGLMSKRLGALGYVREWTHNRRIEPPSTRGAVDRLRQAIARGLEEFTANSRAAALFRALAIGDRRGLSDRDWRIFTRTGTNHLMAISGLHIGIVAGWALWLGSRLWRRSEWLCQRYAALRAGAWLALLLAIGYAALAGFSLPTQRALLMLGVVLGGVILGFRISLGKSLLWALFLV
ncbi:MAG: ComEC/Rec2 family competence protein, partial [Candidatus Thiodiazotropha sp.]